MSYIINGIDFEALEAEHYWSFPTNYKKDKHTEAQQMIFSGKFCAARKMDGAYYRFIKDDEGNMKLQPRNESVNGGYPNKIEWVPQLQSFFDSLPNGTCLLGEIYFPSNEGSRHVTTVMGCLKDKALTRQQKGDKLHYYVFDVWAYNGCSLLKTEMQQRVKTLQDISATAPRSDFVEYGHYYFDGQDIWDKLGEILATGGEGMVLTQINSIPEPGKRTARKTLKMKKELSNTIDCFFTGRFMSATKEYNGKEIEKWRYWENMVTHEKLFDDSTIVPTLTYERYAGGEPLTPISKGYYHGWAASLEIGVINKDTGKVHPIGWLSNVPEEWKENPTRYANLPMEITAMQIDETGGLRHARFVNWRPDLTVQDCTLDKVK